LVGFFEFVRGVETDSYFIDSTAVAVCKNKRIFVHKVFKGLAQRGKSTMGWFLGFKLHLVCNQEGFPIDFRLTPGNTDDRKAGEKLMRGLRGVIVGDKGYISKELFKNLFRNGLRLVTSLRKKMKPQLVTLNDSTMISRRSLIESAFNVLKNSMHLEHSRHRSVSNFMVNLLSTLSAFALRGINGSVFKKHCMPALRA
jgi:transposase